MRKRTPRLCAWIACSSEFQAYRPTHLYCSKSCQRRGYRASLAPRPRSEISARECRRCGASFQPKNTRRVYCSPRCVKLAHYARNPKGWTAIACIECGSDFTPGSGSASLCSKSCRDARRRRTVVPRTHGVKWQTWEAYATRSGQRRCDLCQSTDMGRGWRIDHDGTHCEQPRGCADCVRAHLCSRCNDHLEPAIRTCISLGLMAVPAGPLAAFHGPLHLTPFQVWRVAQEEQP